MFGVPPDPAQSDFLMSVDDVFHLKGRGIAVVGLVRSGVLRSGERVEVWRGDQLATTAEAFVELIGARRPPNGLALLLRDLDGESPQPGDEVRHHPVCAPIADYALG